MYFIPELASKNFSKNCSDYSLCHPGCASSSGIICILQTTCVFFISWVCVFMFQLCTCEDAHMYTYIWRQNDNLGSSYHSPDAVPILFGHRVSHRDLKLSDLDKPVCHWGPVILLLSAPQHWDYRCTLPCLASHLGSGDRIYIVLFSQKVLYQLVHPNRPSNVVS